MRGRRRRPLRIAVRNGRWVSRRRRRRRRRQGRRRRHAAKGAGPAFAALAVDLGAPEAPVEAGLVWPVERVLALARRWRRRRRRQPRQWLDRRQAGWVRRWRWRRQQGWRRRHAAKGTRAAFATRAAVCTQHTHTNANTQFVSGEIYARVGKGGGALVFGIIDAPAEAGFIVEI